ncbi:hypothetical protein TI03_01780 [Achromatium sp. WMS1]|nr:hypothetical protein TI03_01780 [Achromatium sp. WMS1]
MTYRDSDSVIEQIHQTRKEISEKFGGRIAAIAEDAAQRQDESKRLIWKSKKSGRVDKRLYRLPTQTKEQGQII